MPPLQRGSVLNPGLSLLGPISCHVLYIQFSCIMLTCYVCTVMPYMSVRAPTCTICGGKISTATLLTFKTRTINYRTRVRPCIPFFLNQHLKIIIPSVRNHESGHGSKERGFVSATSNSKDLPNSLSGRQRSQFRQLEQHKYSMEILNNYRH